MLSSSITDPYDPLDQAGRSYIPARQICLIIPYVTVL